MSDGLGVTTYSFNVLNQMASRSRNGRTVSYRSTGLLYAYGPEGFTAQLTLGSVRQFTDASGAVILSRSYDACVNVQKNHRLRCDLSRVAIAATLKAMIFRFFLPHPLRQAHHGRVGWSVNRDCSALRPNGEVGAQSTTAYAHYCQSA